MCKEIAQMVLFSYQQYFILLFFILPNVYFHVTNLEQDWDVPHGFAIKGAATSELLIMPGETQTLKWSPDRVGMFPMYCTDFCSALHQEMQGYVRVSPSGSNTKLTFSLGNTAPAESIKK
jgi:nitrous-oxide reductase